MTFRYYLSICTIAASFYLMILSVIYLLKVKEKSTEKYIYNWLLVATIVSIIIEIFCDYAIPRMNMPIWLSDALEKCYLFSNVCWGFVLCNYALYLSLTDRDDPTKEWKQRKPILAVILVIAFIAVFSMPVEHYIHPDYLILVYSRGLAVYLSYGFGLLFVLIASIFNIHYMKIINHRTKLHHAKIAFIYVVFALSVGLCVLQLFIPEVALLSLSEVILVFVMYLFLENPDLKILDKIDDAKIVADKANNAKTYFLSSMSHEIRTPLNAIIGLTEHMKGASGISENVREDIDNITAASNNLLEIIGNIIDINKIESDSLEIIETKYVFDDEIEPLVRVVSSRIGDRPIKLNMTIDKDMPYELIGDKFHIKSIINNLLTNAIKYTNRGTIDFDVKVENVVPNESCTLVFIVKDTGVGIKSENLSKLFNKFERLDFEGSTKIEGSGLGLSITKKIVELMGGSITAESEYNKGSLFTAIIPQKISKMECELTNTQRIDINSINERLKHDTYAGYKALIVDDNKLNLKVARKAVEAFNFEIEECVNGAEVVDKIKAGNKYDIILMDIMMPVKSGEEAMKELLEIPNFNTPVIAVTADAIAGSKEKYLNEGFTDYIAKPFTKDQIKVKIDSVFRHQKDKIEK